MHHRGDGNRAPAVQHSERDREAERCHVRAGANQADRVHLWNPDTYHLAWSSRATAFPVTAGTLETNCLLFDLLFVDNNNNPAPSERAVPFPAFHFASDRASVSSRPRGLPSPAMREAQAPRPPLPRPPPPPPSAFQTATWPEQSHAAPPPPRCRAVVRPRDGLAAAGSSP